ncbi:MAG: vWA domain-containing protein [Gammaproteobacteria bacterium]
MMRNRINDANERFRARNRADSYRLRVLLFVIGLCSGSAVLAGGGVGFAAPGGYGLKIYRVNSELYPFVQVYFRTFNERMQPLVNLNYMNVGVMVKGKSYDPRKQQYTIQSIRQRQEATRTVFVLDASKSIQGEPFAAAVRAAGRFFDAKRPQDEVAILAIRDTKDGYDLVSQFEREPVSLAHRLLDVKADGMKTRLYDSIGAAMQMCGMTAQGTAVAPGAPNIAVSCSILVFSDGFDEGSAISREELNARITSLSIPIPVYSLAYSKTYKDYFKNLEAISKNSFGVYYLLGDTVDRMQQILEEVLNIILSDYVVAFRSYLPVDGEEHGFKLGVEYPSGSGKYTYESSRFEAIEVPPAESLAAMSAQLNQAIPTVPTGPYFDKPGEPGDAAPTGLRQAPVPDLAPPKAN